MSRIVQQGRHSCMPGIGNPTFYLDGTVVACDDCGRWWRAMLYPNSRHNTWRRAWVRQGLARLRGRA